MKRDLSDIGSKVLDLLVIGGGIQGATICWMASLSGLRVGLIEQGDFAQGTSSNTQKIIHGGFRYLKELDLPRVVESIRERSRLKWLAPHLIHPLPCVVPMPNQGGVTSKLAHLAVGFHNFLNITADNHLKGKGKILKGRVLPSPSSFGSVYPVSSENMTNGIIYYDCICYNTERLIISLLKSACKNGALVVNYVKAVDLERTKDHCVVTRCLDQLDTSNQIEIRARKVLNCTGPWVHQVVNRPKGHNTQREDSHMFINGINVIVEKFFESSVAFGVWRSFGKIPGFYFVVPWRDKAIIGTEWSFYKGSPDHYKVNENQCMNLLDEFSRALPMAEFHLEDVLHVHTGLIPLTRQARGKKGLALTLPKRHKLVNHAKDGLDGVFSVLGVKYTTAAGVAERVLKMLFPGLTAIPSKELPKLQGGNIYDLRDFQRSVSNKYSSEIPAGQIDDLIFNFGSDIEEVIKLSRPFDGNTEEVDLLKGQTLFAIRQEMACKLSDVLFRRTGLASAGLPQPEHLERVSKIMADELGWSEQRRYIEMEEALDSLPDFISSKLSFQRIKSKAETNIKEPHL